MLFTEKYAPKKLSEIKGNEEQIEKIRYWILNWLNNKKKKPLLVFGPPGTGKTSVAYVLGQEFDLELIGMSASDFRDKANIERVLSSASSVGSLFGRKKIFLIDDADAIDSRDRGGANAIVKILKDNNFPAIVTAIDGWEKRISAIRTECDLLEFKKVNKSLIKKILQDVAEKEKSDISSELIEKIADSGGDVRSALNDLQAQVTCSRDRERDIFERVRAIFKAKTYIDAKHAFDGDIDYGLLKLWVEENIPNEYEKPEDVALAYSRLSRADIFEGRIKNSAWGYLKYCIDMITAGVSLAKKEYYYKFTKYAFPKYLREMGKTIARRAMLKSIGKKIGAKAHTSSRIGREYIPLIKQIGKGKENDLIALYGFSDDEVAFIMEITVDDIRDGKK